MKICFATHNPNKLREVAQILGEEFDVIGLEDLGCTEEIPENGKTLEENSDIKATHVVDNYKTDCFADDTGLEVEALDGAPGVYSARYAGEPSDSERNMALLLENMAGEANRKARFRTVITLKRNKETIQFEGVVNGMITQKHQGHEGFGYDPIFIPEGYSVTFAEMSSEQKNAISHRGRAIKKLVGYLKSTISPA